MDQDKTTPAGRASRLERLVGRRSECGTKIYAIQKDQSCGGRKTRWSLIFWMPPYVFTSKAAAMRRIKELRDEGRKERIEHGWTYKQMLDYRKYRYVELIVSDLTPNGRIQGPAVGGGTPPEDGPLE